MNTRSAAAWLCVAALAYASVFSKPFDRTHVRGSFDKTDRELKELGIQFTEGHIVNGNDAGGTYPWFVHYGSGICGASLISGNVVLTAAHCVRNGAPATVRIGATNQNDGTEVSVRCANTHPDYDGFVGNDIAVLKLRESVTNTPVTLNTNSAIPVSGETLTVIGLGRTSTGGPASSTLQQVSQTYVDPASCDNSYGGSGGIKANQHLCALTQNAGSCNGDSGGPQIDASQRQVGVVSFGSSQGCAGGIPDGYTRVSTYMEWINAQINDDSCDGCSIWALFCIQCDRARRSVINAASYVFRGESI